MGFQQMTSGMGIFSFLAIPFFIFAGELMLYGGIIDHRQLRARSLVGRAWWPGHVNVVLYAVRRRLGLAGGDVSAMGAR